MTGASVTAMTTPGPVHLGRVTVTRRGSSAGPRCKFPVTLHTGDALHAQVMFAPAAAGGAPAR